jgi:hypothetical protein
VKALEPKSLLSSLYKREELPSLAKRGWGDFQKHGLTNNNEKERK